MGAIDVECKAYMSDATHFADAFNFLVYGGRQVIDSEQLVTLSETEFAFIGMGGKRKARERRRDVLRLWEAKKDEKAVYAILGVENQTGVNFAMPTRNMLYDALKYDEQVNAKRKRHRKEHNEGLKKDEFVSGFSRSDRIMPVVTLVLYFGPSEWDGPMSIHEMLAESDDEILAFVPDYRINLIAPKSIAEVDFDKFRTNLGRVLRYIKHSKDKDELATIVFGDEGYRSLDTESAHLINTVTNSRLPIEEKEGEVDMCEAIEQMRRESELKGRRDAEEEMAPAIEQMRRESELKGRRDAKEEMAPAIEQMRRESERQGKLDALAGLVVDGILSTAEAASRAGVSEGEIEKSVCLLKFAAG